MVEEPCPAILYGSLAGLKTALYIIKTVTMRYVFTTKCLDDGIFTLAIDYVKTLKDFRRLKKQDRSWVLIKNVPPPLFFRF